MEEEFVLAARDRVAVLDMVNTRGWSDIVRPALDMRAEALYKEFLNAEPSEFLRIQQAANAIHGLMDFIEIKLAEGKSALEELRGTGDPQGADEEG